MVSRPVDLTVEDYFSCPACFSKQLNQLIVRTWTREQNGPRRGPLLEKMKMALSLGDKAHRVLRLLLGLRNPRVASAMSAYGLNEEEIQEGWNLLQTLGRGRLGVTPVPPSDAKTIEELDAWENRWFPIADASLLRRYPAVHARVFLNLSQTEGPEVAVSVGTFLDRWEQLGASDGPYGPEGAKAKELLTARGMTPAVIDAARTLLAQLRKVAPAPTPPSAEEQRAELARAEDALWAWYLEWSQVAQIAVSQRVLLRQLGFLSGPGDTTVTPPEPTPTPAVGPGTTAARQ